MIGGSAIRSSLPASAIATLLAEEVKPLLLLGAGASVKSGIPLASSLVELIGKWGYCKSHARSFDDPTLMRSDWAPWVEQQPWFRPDVFLADNYPSAVEAVLRPQENRKTFFQKVLKTGVSPSPGYLALAQLLSRRVIQTVLTTNFDTLIAQSAHSLAQVHAVNEIRTPDDFRLFSTNPRYPQIVYLHGSVEHYTDQNVEAETQHLHPDLVELLTPLLRDHPLVVIGYRGAEPSVMRHLLAGQVRQCNGYRHGIYWCYRKGDAPLDDAPLLSQLIDLTGGNFQLVEIEGFDELMTLLTRSLPELAAVPSSQSPLQPDEKARYPSFDLEPATVRLEDLNEPLLRAKLLAYSKALRLPLPELQTTPQVYAAMAERNLAIDQEGQHPLPTNGGRLLFAYGSEKQLPHAHVQVTVKGPGAWVGEILQLPMSAGMDAPETEDCEEMVEVRGDLWTQLEGVSDLLARVNRPFRLKGPVSQDAYPYPPLALKELLTNLLAHRDYRIERPAAIYISQSEIRFENAGGLVDHVRRQLDEQDIQAAVNAAARGIKGYRNPVIADFFFAAGAMDKKGSGLPDVVDEAANNLNALQFGPVQDNSAFVASIQCRPEALAIDSTTRTAKVVQGELRYSPNLLTVVQWPDRVWKLGAWEDRERLKPAERVHAPPFGAYRNWLWTFADPTGDQVVALSDLVIREECRLVGIDELLSGPDGSVALPRLLNMALASHLIALGLRVKQEHGRLRAYYPSLDGEPREVTYRGLHKQATRTVSKPIRSRSTGKVIFWEHKAVALRFERLGQEWCLALLPCYVFSADGDSKPLQSDKIGPLATKRASRDYNPGVLHDLVFWSRVLSRSSEPSFQIPLTIPEFGASEAPTAGGPSITLSSLVPTVVFQEPVDANMATAVEAEMADDELEALQGEIETLVGERVDQGESDGA